VKMDIKTFIERVRKGDEALCSSPVTCFVGRANQPVFFSRLFGRAPFSASVISASSCDVAQAHGQLSTTFLGQTQCFWVSSLDELNAAAERRWLELLKGYKGPNRAVFFVRDTQLKQAPAGWTVVQVAEKKDLSLIRAIAGCFRAGLLDPQLRAVEEALSAQQTLSLDAITLLIDYVALAGDSLSDFLGSCIYDVITPDTPFFELGSAFFARDSHRFFEIWRNLTPWYGPQFWTAMWSEQLFRAYFYVMFRKRGSFAEAKKISWRLPFSFIQRDWKRFEPDILRRAHRRLTALDHELKNGASDLGLDLFLVRFMSSSRQRSA